MEVRLFDLTLLASPDASAEVEQRSQQRQQRQQTLIDSRRALVLDAARVVFAEKGIEGASVREIAKRAGYTPGAIYSYFDSKEAIYAALLEESLERLQVAVAAAGEPKAQAADLLTARAQAWFGFFAQSPRDLDLCFYLVRGAQSRGLGLSLNLQLTERLQEALRPCEDALAGLGLDVASALRENASLLAHGVGLLLLAHTGRIRVFDQSPDALFDDYLEQLIARLLPDAQPPAAKSAQADLFGRN